VGSWRVHAGGWLRGLLGVAGLIKALDFGQIVGLVKWVGGVSSRGDI
jgi:hypothetical protein